MSNCSPMLVINRETGEVLLGDKLDHNLQCFVKYDKQDKPVVVVKSPYGVILKRYGSLSEIGEFMPVEISDSALQPLSYLGSISDGEDKDYIWHIFGFINSTDIVAVTWYQGKNMVKVSDGYFELGDSNPDILYYSRPRAMKVYTRVYVREKNPNDPGNLYLIYSGDYNVLIYKDWRLYKEIRGQVKGGFVQRAIIEGAVEGNSDKYLDTIIKLCALEDILGSNARLGRYSVHRLLRYESGADFAELDRLINKDDIALKVLVPDNFAAWQFKRAMVKSYEDNIRPIDLSSGRGIDLSLLRFHIRAAKANGYVRVSLKGCHYDEAILMFTTMRWSKNNICSYCRGNKATREFIVAFSQRYSLCRRLSDEELVYWARLLKSIDIKSQVRETN